MYRPKGSKHLSLSQLVITRELTKRITYGRGKYRMLLGHARVNAVSRSASCEISATAQRRPTIFAIIFKASHPAVCTQLINKAVRVLST